MEWRKLFIDNYGYVGVSNTGIIKNKRGKVLFKRIDKSGYERVRVHYRKNNKNKCIDMFVHRLVAQCFIKSDMDISLLQVNHINGDKKDNNVENLEWVTNKENIEHAIRTGLTNSKGESNGKAKLSKDDVEKIRQLWSSGNISRAELSRTFNISWSMIDNIVKNKNWI